MSAVRIVRCPKCDGLGKVANGYSGAMLKCRLCCGSGRLTTSVSGPIGEPRKTTKRID